MIEPSGAEGWAGDQLVNETSVDSSSLMIVAVTPATRVAGGTSRVTTAPAATTEPAPMVTPGRIVAAVPIQTFVSMVMGAPVR